jgi:hypothetical protein
MFLRPSNHSNTFRVVVLVLAAGCGTDDGESVCDAVCDCVVANAGPEARSECQSECNATVQSAEPAQSCRDELHARGLGVCASKCGEDLHEAGGDSTDDAGGPSDGDEEGSAGGASYAAPDADGGPRGDAGSGGRLPDAGGPDACRVCLEAECMPAIESCAGQPECVALNECIGGCAAASDLDACVEACARRHPSGIDPLLAVYECRNESCAVCLPAE